MYVSLSRTNRRRRDKSPISCCRASALFSLPCRANERADRRRCRGENKNFERSTLILLLQLDQIHLVVCKRRTHSPLRERKMWGIIISVHLDRLGRWIDLAVMRVLIIPRLSCSLGVKKKKKKRKKEKKQKGVLLLDGDEWRAWWEYRRCHRRWTIGPQLNSRRDAIPPLIDQPAIVDELLSSKRKDYYIETFWLYIHKQNFKMKKKKKKSWSC